MRRALPWIGITSLLFAGAGVLHAATLRIPCLSGFVRDAGGAAVVNADLDLFDAVSGVKLFTPGDNTDALGYYNVCVLPGIYHVNYAPPPGTRLLGKEIRNVELTTDPGREISVALEPGVVVSGRIRTASGGILGPVDADVDRITGGRLFTPNDKSNPSTGDYRLVVPTGAYRIRFEPPRGERWQGVVFEPVAVRGDTVIDVVLPAGVLLQGRVRSSDGNDLEGIDVDLRRLATGEKVFLANNTTDRSGAYVVAAPAGEFEMRFTPPAGSRLVASRLDSVVVAGDAQIDATLESGVLLSVDVRDLRGEPIAGADLDLFHVQDGAPVFAPYDKTDAAGRASVALLPGTYALEVDPPIGSAFDRVLVDSLEVGADRTLLVQLPEVTRVRVSARVLDDAGMPLPGVKVQANRQPTNQRVYLPNDSSDANGILDLSIPIGAYDLLYFPPQGTRLVGRMIADVPVSVDSAWGDVAFASGVFCSARVEDEAGHPVAGADLDFTALPSGASVFTPYDNSDGNGDVRVVLTPGRYRAVATPPAGSGLDSVSVGAVDVTADTTLLFVLSIQSTPAPTQRIALETNVPNPFREATAVRFKLFAPSDVLLTVHDAAGRLVRTLDRGTRPAGDFERPWDGRDTHGFRVPSGVYFVLLETPEAWETRKLLLIR